MQGAAYAKFIRYTLPLLPFLCLAGAAMWVTTWDARDGEQFLHQHSMLNLARPSKYALLVVLCIVLFCTAFYAFAFLNIYRQTHPWMQATLWLCQHLPAGATIMTEYWDDPLPIHSATGHNGCEKEYVFFTMDMHAADGEEKVEQLLDGIEASDYIVLSSHYYQQLFAERLGFQLVAAPAVYPQLAGITLLDNPRTELPLATPSMLAANWPHGLVFNLGQADESFTVYDHPQPLIFRKVLRLPRQELQTLLKP